MRASNDSSWRSGMGIRSRFRSRGSSPIDRLSCVSFSCLVFARHCSYCHPATDWRQTTQFEGDRFSSSFQFFRMTGSSRKVLQFSRLSLPGGRCTREALGRTGEGPCERSIQNTARLVRTRFRIGKKREEVDTFLRPGKGGQGNACKGWDHYDMILNTARVVVTHRSLR